MTQEKEIKMPNIGDKIKYKGLTLEMINTEGDLLVFKNKKNQLTIHPIKFLDLMAGSKIILVK